MISTAQTLDNSLGHSGSPRSLSGPRSTDPSVCLKLILIEPSSRSWTTVKRGSTVKRFLSEAQRIYVGFRLNVYKLSSEIRSASDTIAAYLQADWEIRAFLVIAEFNAGFVIPREKT